MRAAVLHGPRDIRVEDVPDAKAPIANEVRIRVLASGLCGTDIHEYENAPVLSPLLTRDAFSGHVGPLIIGHEFIGVIDAKGSSVAGLECGQRVAVGAGMWCGDCPACRVGRTNLCASYYTYGLQIDGGMAELVTVPAKMCVVIPEDCGDEDAVLAQPVSIALHAVQRGAVTENDRVAVIGAGGIGSLLVAALRSKTDEITALDVDPGRLDIASQLGASRTALGSADHIGADFDVVFDTSGSESGLATALGLTKRGGRVVAVGLPSNDVRFDARRAVINEIDIVTSSAHVCSINLPEAVQLLAERPIQHLVVDRVVALDDIAESLELLSRRQIAGKVIVRISSAPTGAERD